MALNMTIFSSSGSPGSIVDQTTIAVPEYFSYIMFFIALLSIPAVIVPSVSAIVIIVKNKKLQTNNTTFLVNLLFADVGFAIVIWCTNGLLTLLYLLGVNVDADCTIIKIAVMTLFIASKLMFIPMCVDQLIHIAFPFSYKRIVTTKAITITIITLWMVTMVITTFIYINDSQEYIPSLGICKHKQTNVPFVLVILGLFITPFVLITITSIYLRQRIIKSNNFFHSVKRNAAQQRKSNKAGRLAEILQEQVKPTLAVFRVGGIDAVFDFLFLALTSVTSGLFASSSFMVYIAISQFITIPIQYVQSLNHSLVYNPDIQEKMTDCIRMRNKQSKVIMLH